MIDAFLFLYLFLLAPKLLWERLKGKRHPDLLRRLGFYLPKPQKPVIWIHAVSVGEVKAAQPLFNALKSQNYFFFITTTTATGQAEAKRSLLGADHFAYLPIDFSFVVKRFIKALNPKHFILVESDFWPNLLKILRKNGTKISLVSGKMSQRSFQRFQFFSRFSKRLFDYFDHICVQNEEYSKKFSQFSTHVTVTGNLKFDLEPIKTEKTLELQGPVIAISCTHGPEEELLLEALADGNWTILLAPRHPERFNEVATMLKKKKIAFGRFSKNQIDKVILVDAMGQLPICYEKSRLAILGGSFIPQIGGHNVLEPCLYGTPVLFGPFMDKQTEFAKQAIDTHAGLQIPLEKIRETVELFFQEPQLEEKMRLGAVQAIALGRGATKRTLEAIH